MFFSVVKIIGVLTAGLKVGTHETGRLKKPRSDEISLCERTDLALQLPRVVISFVKVALNNFVK
jgi:hypothetical protein